MQHSGHHFLFRNIQMCVISKVELCLIILQKNQTIGFCLASETEKTPLMACQGAGSYCT